MPFIIFFLHFEKIYNNKKDDTVSMDCDVL